MTDTRKNAIAACQTCHLLCQETLAYHGDETGGRQLSPQHIKRLMACIEICQTTANLLAIRAPLIDQLCEICAHICEQCASSCRAVECDEMRQCANAAGHCASACYEASNHIKKAA
ncbi:MAG: four-helix bundle copper-binding protein [Micavibrio aeruginosavorus]|uniref:Four-helix bundle copper-binding protein n=1 Tax=Micavibrio aeruginosavorus TaxID=349221 RepID=A0A7T5UHM9_9BACT|nr:MAG: four-helix bundle copper-binding protein [Micavibrio aeruginosavorus]